MKTIKNYKDSPKERKRLIPNALYKITNNFSKEEFIGKAVWEGQSMAEFQVDNDFFNRSFISNTFTLIRKTYT